MEGNTLTIHQDYVYLNALNSHLIMLTQQQMNVLLHVLVFIMHSKIIELVFECALDQICIVRILQLHVYKNVHIHKEHMLTI